MNSPICVCRVLWSLFHCTLLHSEHAEDYTKDNCWSELLNNRILVCGNGERKLHMFGESEVDAKLSTVTEILKGAD